MKKIFYLFFLVFSCSVWADSFILINDSPFPLDAEVLTNDGRFVSKIFVPRGRATEFRYNPGDRRFEGLYENYPEEPMTAIIPFTVIWYCESGEQYAICRNVYPGEEINAQACGRLGGTCPESKKYGPNRRIDPND